MQYKRLFDFPHYQLETFPREDALVSKVNGEWIKTSTQSFVEQANAVSRGLLRLGVQKNDKIAIISTTNRTEWNIMDIGIMQTGAQDVPIYPTISEEDYAYVLNHSESKYVFVSDKEVYDKVMKIKDQVASLIEVYSFEDISGCKSWKDLKELGKDDSNQPALEDIMASIDVEDLATLIYTSGTTGRPKGVMLSHKNISSNAMTSAGRLPLELGESKALSFLPVCHIYERMLQYMYTYTGTGIYFAESLETISDNLKEISPEVMSAVPRLLEKVYDKIITKGSDLTGIKKKLFFWAVELGLEWEPYGANGWWYEKKLGLAKKIIFSKWQEALGGNLKAIASGSAALQPRLARVFNAAGVPVMEGYGLTETSPVISVNDMRDGGFKIGTVGKMLADTDVIIAADGEIMINGPQRMMGYYKDEEKTKEAIDENGYFHTGDIGEIDSEGFLKITDRKKEMFKTSGGKYVAPQLIENMMKQSRFIEQIMVIGEGEKMPAAFIQPNFQFLTDWAKHKGIAFENWKDLCSNERVIARYQREVEEHNQKFGKWERVKTFELTPEEWTIQAEHLTPTLKLKRRNIKARYQDLYIKIYGSKI
ncbi:long-chain fatty acid--CoA ligase [Nonlabens sp. MB-3u-79]|uniref:AMP-dependent synthetase/ligase n=1 Tax=Nonlabens sp. MB-3u-79 TaxID=2058134 RepID=UPI000C30C3F9|nr:AMP-dependent synthetase/ligase [Nonlabens sp. MB-3u-79]AUC79687.1 long-chain fatty acid--CoA ligase [Nonlabens sp. MB-3u-79]|tara:strand:- start:5065 stop:6843 length:1779 start_codon:yes stop_codon:yes gene_type:complete